MKPAVAFFLCAAMFACVDGKTPDCTTVDSGCFPEDSSGPVVDSAADTANASDAGDASSTVPDAPVD